MARAEQHPTGGNTVFAILVVGALLLGVVVLGARQLSFDSPASHHARTLLKLDSTLGATLEPLDARAARMLGGGSRVDEMVVTSIAAGGRASAAGLRVGDVVEEVDGKDPSDLEAAIGAVSTDPTRIVVNRHGSRVMLNVPAPGTTAHG
ncbi:MAG TPA: PDZ domain-containing protein [Sphingomicrobium sp.]|nr:PDZ domain-containing protein [Sphingomicrobium sp.]